MATQNSIGGLDSAMKSSQVQYYLPAFIFIKISFSRGTDGFAHPPNLTKNDKIHIYNENMCRTIPLEFEKEIGS